MRILIISDIHANLEALDACLQAAPAHDRVFNLGDIVGYGANPNEVTERARQLGTVFVRGNHDKCVHASPRDEDEYVLMRREAYSLLAHADAPVTFFGHTHVQGGFWIDDSTENEGAIEMKYASVEGKQEFTLKLAGAGKYMINPGSVGQPRDGDPRAAFALYDTDKNSVTYHRVPYDVAAAQEKIFAAGLPERLAIRLEEGR